MSDTTLAASHLVGHDRGVSVARVTAHRHPGRIRSPAMLSRPYPAAFRRAHTEDAPPAPGPPHRAGRPGARDLTDEAPAAATARLRSHLDRHR